MDCPITAKHQSALACFSAPNQHRILQYLAHLAARQYTDLTLNAVVRALPAFLRLLPKKRHVVLAADLTQTTAQDISVFITAAQVSGLAPSTINTKVSLLAGFFEYLREEGQMTQHPVLRRRHRLLTPTVLPKPIPDADLAAFFQVIDSVRDRLIFLFMLRCGLRVSEVCALGWDAIDLDADTVRINQGKGRVDRIVYLSPDVKRALTVWRAHHRPGVYLFPSPQRRRAHLFRSMINRLMDQYLVAAGLTRHYSPHCLRHTFATHLLNAGVSLEVLKELMGHHSLDDIDWTQQSVRINQGKGRKDRLVYLSADALAALRTCLTARPTVVPDGLVFWNQKCPHRPLSAKGIQKKMERYAKAAGIKASCHSLRHTFASNLLEAGAEVISIKELLGHASVKSSERYAKLSNQRVKQVYQQTMRKVIAKTRV